MVKRKQLSEGSIFGMDPDRLAEVGLGILLILLIFFA